MNPSSLRALLRGAVDYAGLFPPAQLDMAGAVAEYASYAASSDVWALGRFVLPASRLEEFANVARELEAADPRALGTGAVWPLSVVLGADLAADAQRVQSFQEIAGVPPAWTAVVGSVELRAATVETIAKALAIVPETLERFVEVPVSGDVGPLVRAVRDANAFAKVRTGGTTADAFPSSADLARFLAICVRERVSFKATAGLHHPLRGDYPLTYEPGSACGRMYGFLNVFLATALLAAGRGEGDARRMLEEEDPSAVGFDELGVRWREARLSVDQLSGARNLITSFGSCSFREPIDDLTALGLLAS